jgi:hypothetical protein
MTGDYRKAFPSFGELGVELPDHFEDVSWRNEPCPCFHSAEARAFLYIDYADAAQREFPETERFVLQAAGEDGQHLEDESRELLSTDDFGLVLERIEARRAEFDARPAP